MKEIKATAPTPQDWIALVRENERLKFELSVAVMLMSDLREQAWRNMCDYLLENKDRS
jgi:hypothetical protein